jgi:hypothetical protein
VCECVKEWTPSYYTFVAYLCVVPSLFQDSQLATVWTLTPVSKIGPPSPKGARLIITIHLCKKLRILKRKKLGQK